MKFYMILRRSPVLITFEFSRARRDLIEYWCSEKKHPFSIVKRP